MDSVSQPPDGTGEPIRAHVIRLDGDEPIDMTSVEMRENLAQLASLGPWAWEHWKAGRIDEALAHVERLFECAERAEHLRQRLVSGARTLEKPTAVVKRLNGWKHFYRDEGGAPGTFAGAEDCRVTLVGVLRQMMRTPDYQRRDPSQEKLAEYMDNNGLLKVSAGRQIRRWLKDYDLDWRALKQEARAGLVSS